MKLWFLGINQLFKIVDGKTNVISMQSNISNILKEIEIYLEDREKWININIDKYCHNPYVCNVKEYCWKIQRQISDYSIFNIFNIGSKKQIV